MNKYIDADLLLEKISEQMELLPREVGRGAGTITSVGYGMMQAFQIMRSIIDSLQSEQPGADLEKEVRNIFNDKKNRPVSFKEFMSIALRFYKLGLNTRKEE